MAKINQLCVGESLVGDGNEVAHIDLIMGPRGSAAETAFANCLTNNKDGFTSLLAVVAPNLLCKPATVMFNKVTIKGAKQAVQMFGPAQHAVAKAVADSVAEGVIPQDEADNIFICCRRLHSLGSGRRQEDSGLQLSRRERIHRTRRQRRADGLPRSSRNATKSSIRSLPHKVLPETGRLREELSPSSAHHFVANAGARGAGTPASYGRLQARDLRACKLAIVQARGNERARYSRTRERDQIDRHRVLHRQHNTSLSGRQPLMAASLSSRDPSRCRPAQASWQ